MSKFIKYNTNLTDVTSFSGNFDNRALSGRPEFTAGNTYTTLTCGFTAQKSFIGYSLDSVESVLISCYNNQNVFVSAADFTNWPLTGFSSFSTLCDGATLSPAMSGLLTSNYTLNNYNMLTVTFPEITATGSIDIIPMNVAGYGSIVRDINTTITID
tara:strand:+ start:169 stop:639 length:471 start_codon:yes stop_codon:yes gene_type:complete